MVIREIEKTLPALPNDYTCFANGVRYGIRKRVEGRLLKSIFYIIKKYA